MEETNIREEGVGKEDVREEDIREGDIRDKDTELTGQEPAGERAASEEAGQASGEACSEESSAEGTEQGEESEEQGMFGGRKKKDKKEAAYEEKIEQLEDRVKRQLAEFENFRSRSEREKAAMFETGARSVIEKILPVIDNFERGLATVSDKELENPFVDGMNRVYKQLLTELEAIGVKPIEAVGHEFDPNLHNAVMQVESEELESGMVAQELLKGYTYRDGVVRHSMVGVVS